MQLSYICALNNKVQTLRQKCHVTFWCEMLSSSSVLLPSEVSDTNLPPFKVLPKPEPVVFTSLLRLLFPKFRFTWKEKNRGVAQHDRVLFEEKVISHFCWTSVAERSKWKLNGKTRKIRIKALLIPPKNITYNIINFSPECPSNNEIYAE